jgi:hypothetical protein
VEQSIYGQQVSSGNRSNQIRRSGEVHSNYLGRSFSRIFALSEVPGGFDYAGRGLHYAALNGHRAMVQFLLDHGADRSIKDTKVNSTAAGWAEHGGHRDLRDLLSSVDSDA